MYKWSSAQFWGSMSVLLQTRVKMDFLVLSTQCSKLRVHPAHCVHILAAGGNGF